MRAFSPTSARQQRAGAVLLAAAMVLLLPALASADAPPGPYFNGFETDTSGWFDTTNGGSGTISRTSNGSSSSGYASGISSATGTSHARVSGGPCVPPTTNCFGPNTRWGGYNQTFPINGYRTYLAIYLDTAWAATHPDARFDWISAISNSAGAHLRDFVFNAGTNRATDAGPAGFFINASTNSTRSGATPYNTCPNPPTPGCRVPVHITTPGWYTFVHTFRADAGFLAVDFDIVGVGGAHWTITSGDAMGTVGGNRYGWFSNEEIPELPIDDSERTGLDLALTPASATNLIGTSHTVTATATSTESNRPMPGPGVPVEFDVVSGPNMGQTSHPVNTGTCSPSACTTDANGHLSWTYTSNGASGTDTIRACFADRPLVVQRPGDDARTCATATKTWATNSIGKVTGGGQIQGDPIFAVNGALLSVPAIVPSLAGSGSQASFGFVVQSSGTPKGNLEYNDKPAGVRIKAITIDTLFISTVSCGSHAQFSGSAQVTRPTGTTTESFTVDVDDCGEPGTADTFAISTSGGYANGPSTLIGGNIQIHN